MKIILASNVDELNEEITKQFRSFDNINLTVVDIIDDLLELLKRNDSDMLISDYTFDGTNIWQLSKLLNSKKIIEYAIPTWLIKDTYDIEIPDILAREHGFRAVSLESLPEEFQKALETTENWRPSQKPSLILLEDDEDAITIAKLALEKEYAIDIARNGSDGLKLWKQKRHNLVLLDYMLPGMKGNEVLTEIMAIDNNQPVIVMTAYDKPELNKDFILNGASQYLPKPFTLTELRMHCRMVLNKSNLIYQSCYHEMIFKKLTKQIFELDSCIRQNNLKKAQAVIGDIRQELALQLSEDDLINFDSVSV